MLKAIHYCLQMFLKILETNVLRLMNLMNLIKNRKGRKACLWYRRQRKIGCSHKSFKASIKSWFKRKNVHRIIQFNQKAWLKPYIEMNTKLRREAKNEFEKDFFKLINNSVFGKQWRM